METNAPPKPQPEPIILVVHDGYIGVTEDSVVKVKEVESDTDDNVHLCCEHWRK